MNPLYPLVAMRAAHRCEYCRAPEVVFNFPFEVERITPRSLGGLYSDVNCALSCRACNLRKSDQVSGIDPDTSAESRLFNPREDRWEEHFTISVDNAEITGTTAIGRATVACLKMNSDAQIAARRQWLRLGIFS